MKRWQVALITGAVAATVAALFHAELVAWFSPPDRAARAARAPAAHDHGAASGAPATTAPARPPEPAEPAIAPTELPAPARSAVAEALDALERVRAELVLDRHDGVAAPARLAARALGAARAATTAPAADVAAALDRAREAAEQLAASAELDGARVALAEVNRQLIGLAAADPRLQEGWRVFRCPMAPGFRKWVQRGDDLGNPYMGQAMPACGSSSSWGAPSPSPAAPAAVVSHDGHGHAGGDVAHYTCSMHPSIRAADPGQCPICAMDLTPVTFDEHEGGVVIVEEARRGPAGIRTGKVVRAPMTQALRALGRVTYDEAGLRDVTLRLGGWITKLHVTRTGQAVRQGQVMFTLYSPELYAAQQEYLLARARVADPAARAHAAALADASARKLELWGLTAAQVARIAERGEPMRDVPFHAPASGYVIEKLVVEGAAFEAGQRLFRIAALDRVWVEVDVYEADLDKVRVGQAASLELSHQAGPPVAARVAYVYPYLDPGTRTGKVRLELPNAGHGLKPDMYATVTFALDLGPRLQVPVDAVVYTGPRRLVFVDLGEGRLGPREVTLGVRTDDAVEVLTGLAEGETVVTSGNFLVAAESRIRSAAKLWTEERAGGAP